MDITYKRDGNRNYMILEKSGQKEASFQEKMLLNGEIEGLLTCTLRGLNGEGYYYYDICAKQPLSMIFEHKLINEEEISVILSGLSCLFSTLENYLLPVKNIILLPECIYMGPEGRTISFCYYPDFDQELETSFTRFSEFLIERIDHSDERAAEAAYLFDKNVSEQKYNPKELLGKCDLSGLIEEEEVSKSEEVTLEELLWDNQEPKEEDFYRVEAYEEDTLEEDKGIPHLKKLIICGMIVLLAAVAYLAALFNPSLLEAFGLTQQDYMVAGAIIAALFGGIIIAVVKLLFLRDKKKEQKEEEESREKEIQGFRADVMEEEEYRVKEEGISEIQEEFGKTTLLSECNMPKAARLQGQDENGHEICLVIKENPFIVGKLSGRANGILEDSRVSRVHAAIRKDSGHYYISDLNSTNGTFINGEQLNGTETVLLTHNDMVRFAGIDLRFLEH